MPRPGLVFFLVVPLYVCLGSVAILYHANRAIQWNINHPSASSLLARYYHRLQAFSFSCRVYTALLFAAVNMIGFVILLLVDSTVALHFRAVRKSTRFFGACAVVFVVPILVEYGAVSITPEMDDGQRNGLVLFTLGWLGLLGYLTYGIWRIRSMRVCHEGESQLEVGRGSPFQQLLNLVDGDMMVLVAILYPTDRQKRLDLYEKAAQNGHVNALALAADACRYGSTRDETREFFWNQEAALRGHPLAMQDLANHYQLENDLEQAVLWNTRAAEKGNHWAMSRLSEWYRKGMGVAQDWKQAEKWAVVAAEQYGEPLALISLGESLENGFDGRRDTIAAECFYRKAAGLGEAWAEWMQAFLEEKANILGASDFAIDSDKQIDMYLVRIVALIGRGQFGEVYLAQLFDIPRRREVWVAIKIIRTSIVTRRRDVVFNTMRERLTNLVISHRVPHTVKYLGILNTKTKACLVFEICADLEPFLESANELASKQPVWLDNLHESNVPDWTDRVATSLRSAVVFPRFKRFDARDVVVMLRKVAEALNGIHQLGFLHRDIADRNVLCDSEGNVKLADFGLAKYVGRGHGGMTGDEIRAYSKFLTPGHQYAIAWWAPECIGSQEMEGIFSTKSDIYAFGVLMWQCFAHRDPFDSLLTTSDPAHAIAQAILSDQRPDLDHLGQDTPPSIVWLLEGCWEADPTRRPKLPEIIAELERVEEDPREFLSSSVVRSSRGIQSKWFDVQSMYRKLPSAFSEVRQLVQEAVHLGPTSFPAGRLQSLCSKALERKSAAMRLPPMIVDLFDNRPYDVFLLHAGEQKEKAALPLQEYLELSGFRCFLDRGMSDRHGSPVGQMREALETCRYAVVIVSQAFAQKKHPCAELDYAYQRKEWIEKQRLAVGGGMGSWRSLNFIFYDLSVADYSYARKDAHRCGHLAPLPRLEKSNVVKEWMGGRGHLGDWNVVCEQICTELLVRDKNDQAVQRWRYFLREWKSFGADFPRASKLYS